MKKLILILFVLVVCVIPVQAKTWKAATRVAPVGEMILKKNSLPSDIKFQIVNGVTNNSQATSTNTVQISSNDIIFTENDNELAYVIAYELGGIINHAFLKEGSNDAKAADIMGTDLMINSGYNPLAGIVVLAKMQDSNQEISMGKPVNHERAVYLYDYLAYNYPTKVKIGYNSQEYKNFLTCIEPHIKEISGNKKKRAKFNKNQAKLKAKRTKQLAKHKNTNILSKWNITYDLLQSLTEPEKQ